MRLRDPRRQRPCGGRDGNHLRRSPRRPPQPGLASPPSPASRSRTPMATDQGRPARDATMVLGVGTDNSVRWLMGEDNTAVGLTGALRDMWNPRCFGNPGKVSDTFEYAWSAARQRRRSHQLGGSEPRLCAARRRRELQRPDHQRHRTHQGGPHLLPGHERLPGAGERLRRPRRRLEQSCSDLVGSTCRPRDGRPVGPDHLGFRLRPGRQGALAVEMRSRPPSATSSRSWPRTRPTVAKRERSGQDLRGQLRSEPRRRVDLSAHAGRRTSPRVTGASAEPAGPRGAAPSSATTSTGGPAHQAATSAPSCT